VRILAPILLAAALLACAEEEQTQPVQPAVATVVPEPPTKRPQGVVVGCQSQSGYDFADASLGYGPLPQEVELTPKDGHRVVTFRPCSAEQAWSRAGEKPVTFWSGFMLTDTFVCMPIDVWVDDEPKPRQITLGMGVRDCA
jgi:hypothetical protein